MLRLAVDLAYKQLYAYRTIFVSGPIEDNCLELSMSQVDLDSFDRKIIDVLAVNGRITVTDLAKEVGLSKTPCQMRLRRLIETGVITGFQATMSSAKLGMDHVAFTEVKLSDTRERALEEFNASVRRIPEVEECHMIASSFDYLLKVRTADIKRYRIVLGERISSLPHVASTSTYVAMETVKDR